LAEGNVSINIIIIFFFFFFSSYFFRELFAFLSNTYIPNLTVVGKQAVTREVID